MSLDPQSRRLSIAPMLDWSDRHMRYLWRMLCPEMLLYTEMVVAQALIHAGPKRFLRYHVSEHPLALQLGGSDPRLLAECAKMAEQEGFDEVNLNCGCPSDRVQSGRFGACLMGEADLVAECVHVMKSVVQIPITVKTRIGIDHQDSWEFFDGFLRTVSQGGVDTFIIHARKAWLKGLSPKENREKPPLDYGFAYRLKSENPQWNISLNGGVKTLAAVDQILHGEHVHPNDSHLPVALDGVMVGREAYENPWFLAQASQIIFGGNSTFTDEKELLKAYIPYLEEQLAQGVPLHIMTKHLNGFFQGRPGARKYRQMMGEMSCKADMGIELVKQALEVVA